MINTGSLERLDLSYNLFEEVPVETGNLELLQETGEWEIGIGMLTKLRYLDFRGCRLKEWSPQLEKLEQLQELYLSENEFTEIPPEISDLKRLRVFHVSANMLRILPTEFYAVPLEEFRAQHNELIDFPECHHPEDVHVPTMRYFDVSHNALESLDRRVSIFPKLKTLMAQNNHIQTLSPDCFSLTTTLTYLDLSHNQLSEMSPSLANATHLTHCDLSYNNLTEVPPCFFRSGRLKILKLDHNMIGEISGRVMGMLNDLERLEMQYNLIKGPLPPLLFAVKKLVYVDLSHNQVDSVPMDLGNWTKIIHLNLSYNAIGQIPDTLGELKELIFLELDHNCLLDVPTTIANLKKLEHFTLHSNRLSASPHVLELLPHLHFMDMSWNIDIPAHFLTLEEELVDADSAVLPTERKKEIYTPFHRRKRRILRINRAQQKKRYEDLEKRIAALMERIDELQTALRKQEQDFIGNKRTNATNFEQVKSWFHRLRRHFNSERVDIHELQTTSAERLKNQTDVVDFNTALEEILVNIQAYKGNLRDRLYFSNLALNQNRVPRWYAGFLDFVKEHHERADQIESTLLESHADDVLSEVFLGLDAYPVLEDICCVLHELNLLTLLEELDADLYHLDTFGDIDEMPPPPPVDVPLRTTQTPEKSSRGFEFDDRGIRSSSSRGMNDTPNAPSEPRSRQSSIYSDDEGTTLMNGGGRTRMLSNLDETLQGIAEIERESSGIVSSAPGSPDHESTAVVDDADVPSSSPGEQRSRPSLVLHQQQQDEASVHTPEKNTTLTGKKNSFFAGLASPMTSIPGTPNLLSRGGRTTASPQPKSSRMFFSFSSSSTKGGKKSDNNDAANAQTNKGAQQSVQLKVESLGVNIKTNDLPRVLYLMKHLIDIDIFMSYHYAQHRRGSSSSSSSTSNEPPPAVRPTLANTRASFQRVFSGFGANQQSWVELPSMNINFHCLQQADRQSLDNYLAAQYSVIRENPFGRTLFTLYFEANQVLGKTLTTVIDYLTRGIRSMERENEESASCIDLANRDHFFQFHTPDEEELREREKFRLRKKQDEEKRKKGSIDFTSTGTLPGTHPYPAHELDSYDPNVTEVECIEDFGDLLRDVYNALSQDKKMSDKKDKQLSLKDRYKRNVQEFLTMFEDKGGLDEMKYIFDNDFKNSTSALAKKSSTITNASIHEDGISHSGVGDGGDDDLGSVTSAEGRAGRSRRPSYIMKRSSSNLQDSFNTRRSSQANLRKKLAAWQAAEDDILKKVNVKEQLLGKDKILGGFIIAWLADFRKLLSGWLLQCVENNGMILCLRGIDINNYEGDFVRNFNILRDPSDPVYQRMMAFKKNAPKGNDDDDDNPEDIVYLGTPSYVTHHLLTLTRRYMLVRSRAYQIFGYYAEAMRAFDSAISLHAERLPQEFFVNYVKVCLTGGHFFRAKMLMERIIRKFVMPKYPEIKDLNRKKAAGKHARRQLARTITGKADGVDEDDLLMMEEDELFSDVQLLPVEREIAILTRYANTQAARLDGMFIREEVIHKKSLFPHATFEEKKEEDMDDFELVDYHARPPELRYGRQLNIKEINARRIQEDAKVKMAQEEEQHRWETLRKCKDAQFRSRVVLDAEEMMEMYGISMATIGSSPSKASAK